MMLMISYSNLDTPGLCAWEELQLVASSSKAGSTMTQGHYYPEIPQGQGPQPMPPPPQQQPDQPPQQALPPLPPGITPPQLPDQSDDPAIYPVCQ